MTDYSVFIGFSCGRPPLLFQAVIQINAMQFALVVESVQCARLQTVGQVIQKRLRKLITTD